MQILDKIQIYNQSILNSLPKLEARNLINLIDWNDRLIGIIGAKGVGKTTLLLQHMQLLTQEGKEAIYISLDHPLVTGASLYEIVEQHQLLGGELVFLDEVHKYDNWSAHIKAIYDSFPQLKIIFSGSSTLQLHKGKGDLSRRASLYTLPILSFREFLHLETKQNFKSYSLEDICSSHISIAQEISAKIKPLALFKRYIQHGAYPFYQEGLSKYFEKLNNIVTQTLESDLVIVHGLDGRYINKLKKLLNLVATSVPFVPKVTDIASAIELSRPVVSQYLEYLQEGGLIALIRAVGKGYQKLSKPEKIYIDNTNLLTALSYSNVEIGTVRETFFMSQIRAINRLLEVPTRADFIIDGKVTFEVGGRNKEQAQIKDTPNSYLACDNIEIGFGKRIPLWLFGMMY